MINTFVFDTNTLISAHLLPSSVSRRAYDKAFEKGILTFSKATFHEFMTTFSRPKFDRYQTLEDRLKMISLFERRGQLTEVKKLVTICRDPEDDMFLSLALTTKASCIVTGDPDLLVLHPFRRIPIFSPSDFLNKF